MTHILGNKTVRNIIFVLILVLGTALSIIVSEYSYYTDRKFAEAKFNQAVDNRYSALKREFDSDLAVLASFQALYYSARSDVGKSEFKTFAGHILKQPASIQALEWIPRVPDSKRDGYERAARREGFPDFKITERVDQGMMARAEKRKEYFPIYFIEPYKGNESAIGFDLASDPAQAEALKVARKTGEMFATSGITLPQDTKSQDGFLVFAPIYNKKTLINSEQARWDNLEGFFVGVFRISDIADKSLNYLNPEGIDIFIYDTSVSEKKRFLYAHPSRTGKTPLLTQEQPETDLTITKTLDVAGQKWMIVYSATPGFIAEKINWHPFGFFLAGLTLTGLVTALLLIFSHSEYVENMAKDLLDVNTKLSNEIAERRKAEAMIEASEQKLKALFNTVNDAILLVDSESHILDVNDITCNRLGYRREELLKMTPLDFVTPEYASKVPERITESRQEGSSIFETAWVTRDGRIIPTEISSRTVSYEGKPVLLGVARDISERKQADSEKNNLLQELKMAHDMLEARVRERTAELTDANSALRVLLGEKAEDRDQIERGKKKLQTFFDGITEPMFMTALDGNIVIANRAATAYCDNCSIADIIGRHINEMLSPHYGVTEAIAKALGSGFQTSFVLKRKQGSTDRFFIYPVLINGRHTGEDIIRIVDVTKEKVLEQQMIHTEKLAALGLLVAGIAHEINNPSNFITFNMSVLHSYLGAILPIVDDYAATQSNFVLLGFPYAEFRKDMLALIDDVEKGAQRIASIVRELREFSRKGDVEERSLVAPMELVERVIAMCKRSAVKEHVKIDVVEEKAFPALNLPAGTCEQVLVNLIINAIQAADKDQAHVTVIIKQGLTWSDYLTFIVEDNGKGMDDATVARIFNPFFTLKPRGEGTGLGLYISKILVNKLGGDIMCSSTPGKGSVFTVTLPREVLDIGGAEGL